MGLFDKLIDRDRAGATPAASGADVMTGEQAQAARVRARRRLIGAIVLLGVGVIAFPLLFETQPRPIPVDIPIVIPPRDGAAPLVLPRATATPAASAPVAEAPATAPAPEAQPNEAAKPAVAEAPPAPKPAAEAPKPVPKPKAVEAPKPVAEAPKPAPPATTTAGRFVVQIGAFADVSAVRDARSKAQKAGLATFTQVVETSSGKRTRVRVGPFASREEADKAAAQVKAAGLPGSVLTL